MSSCPRLRARVELRVDDVNIFDDTPTNAIWMLPPSEGAANNGGILHSWN